MNSQPKPSTASIHTFDRPPVIEVVLGVQFARLSALGNPLLGKFWAELGNGDWPAVDEAPPIDPQYERFGNEREWGPAGKINLRLTQNTATRLRITNPGRTRMIQVQNGRLHYNWLKVGNEPYPRFGVVKQEFDASWSRFCEFIRGNGLGEPVPDQWEATYINHMPKGSVWSSPSDWARLFRGVPSLRGPVDFLLPENFLTRFEFEIADRVGRLHVEISHGFSSDPSVPDREEVIRMALTARGPIKKDSMPLDAGLARGRQAIVEAFYNLTSDDAHKVWGLQNG